MFLQLSIGNSILVAISPTPRTTDCTVPDPLPAYVAKYKRGQVFTGCCPNQIFSVLSDERIVIML